MSGSFSYRYTASSFIISINGFLTKRILLNSGFSVLKSPRWIRSLEAASSWLGSLESLKFLDYVGSWTTPVSPVNNPRDALCSSKDCGQPEMWWEFGEVLKKLNESGLVFFFLFFLEIWRRISSWCLAQLHGDCRFFFLISQVTSALSQPKSCSDGMNQHIFLGWDYPVPAEWWSPPAASHLWRKGTSSVEAEILQCFCYLLLKRW